MDELITYFKDLSLKDNIDNKEQLSIYLQKYQDLLLNRELDIDTLYEIIQYFDHIENTCLQ
ncbi:MAG: hypothetical protein LUH02_12380, partial [Erysipelotrichaceae bacterium]|nr:hypothetical protein [Erysipelotrichaceae bacterium]